MHLAGWDGACQGAGDTCVLRNLSATPTTINAGVHFAVTTHVLTVEVNDYSLGLVEATGNPIKCGST
jgi:hypothetical protein